MSDSIWAFLQDENHRGALTLIGGGVATVAAGIWAAFTFVAKKSDDKRPPANISADHGSVAGGHISNTTINVGTSGRRKP
jgi:hypothetical protein